MIKLVTSIALGAVLAVPWFPVASGPGSSAPGRALQAKSAPPAKPAAVSPDELDRLLGPIALYPDQLLAQVLLGATNPGKVAALDEWLASNQTLKGTALQDAATAAGFEPHYVALTLFPQVITAMASQMDWTSRLGQAFGADRSAVFASIQRLRAKARDAGKLKSNAQQAVETKTTSSGQQVIVIEPANPQVVYVPQYNPQVVYTQPSTTTVVVQEDDSDAAVAAGLIGFTAGIAIGAAFDNDYYYGPYGMRGGVYMYDDAWDDWADHREDAREDWQDHREDIVEDRGERAGTAQEQRTERQQTRQDAGTQSQAQRTERQQTRQAATPESQAQREQRRTDAQAAGASTGATSQAARGYSRDTSQATARERSGTKSDAFSGYGSGKSERAASSRGKSSRSSSRGGGSRRR
jgi:hypothetical protein